MESSECRISAKFHYRVEFSGRVTLAAELEINSWGNMYEFWNYLADLSLCADLKRESRWHCLCSCLEPCAHAEV